MVGSGGAPLLLLAPLLVPTAWACSLSVPSAHAIDPTLDDDTSPAAITGAVGVEVRRGRGPVEMNGACGSSSCDDIGLLTLTFAAAIDDGAADGADSGGLSDDRLQPAVGYQLRLRSGALAAGLALPAAPQAAWLSDDGNATLMLVWGDGATDRQEPFSAQVSIEPVDAAGNIGPARQVTIADDGRAATASPCAGTIPTDSDEAAAPSGCQVARGGFGGRLGGAAWVGLLGLLSRRRTGLSAPARRSHAPARARSAP